MAWTVQTESRPRHGQQRASDFAGLPANRGELDCRYRPDGLPIVQLTDLEHQCHGDHAGSLLRTLAGVINPCGHREHMSPVPTVHPRLFSPREPPY
jgi:hypothetical protein